jgi:predicted amino acid racemase
MFLAATRRRNPALIETAAALHAEGRVPAGSYVVDIDTVAANARLVSDAALARGLVCWQMTKQFGRNPLVAAAVAANGIDGIVAVEMAEARVLHAHGLRIGHVGHLVKVPRNELAEAVSFAPDHVTVFGVEQAAAVGAAARAAGIVQAVLLRVVGPDDLFFEAQRGGVHLAGALDAARAIEQLDGVELVGVTTFPAVAWNEAAGDVAATPNLATIVAARDTLRAAGFAIPVMNAPGMTCAATLDVVAAAGATHVEPGSALIGETPWHAVNDANERPAMVYVSEVTHQLDDRVYTLGGGFYSRSRMRSALVFGEGEPLEADVVELPPAEIDYYGALRLPAGRRAAVGATVVYAFRAQSFVTRAPVAVVGGVGGSDPQVLGIFSRDGSPLAMPHGAGRT